ncbi:hypothetical protein FGG79_05100 [Bacillus sp. BHET2]|uniref:hypothetical protein n=1 Tax=Bacillus sp. BHET2 TaxID=2583818 RepID=UPI00110F1E7A|nr:hypothetical protein [Bacillus sp. BHET2]TMU87504.1 hypothetical protein FGG79_05100 [Bacillus sp. BHET2]
MKYISKQKGTYTNTLEFFRFIFIFFFLGAFIGGSIKLLYKSLGINVDGTSGAFLVILAILLILLLMYKNWLQFSGFMNVSREHKLSYKTTYVIGTIIILLIVFAPFVP